MKKLISYLCVFALVLALAPAAFAEWDLSGLSYDDLVALKDQVQRAMWDSADWQEVTVPQGVWEVGADIPAGKWTIKCNDGHYTEVTVGVNLKPSGDGLKYPYSAADMVYNPGHKLTDSSDLLEWTVDLHDGDYVEIDDAPAVFTPYAGKPSLGFK